MLRPTVRVLDDRDQAEAHAILDSDPVGNVFVRSRVNASGLAPWRLGAELWGFGHGGRLSALCYAGANLVPVGVDAAAAKAFAGRVLRSARRCSSIVGRVEAVAPLWHELVGRWDEPREIRDRQPLLVIDTEPEVAPDPLVRRVRIDELDVLLPASVAMFTEEVGVSPVGSDGGALYRARVAELVAAGRAFARIEDGCVVFKAEVGAATPAACQVQGVWVRPDRRGQGLAAPAMAAVVTKARREVAPKVSLYVNDFNIPARRAYARVGFKEAGTFMSVLF
ncbi:MAG: GNAT family N-acetyltransferase [Mycobacteriales bacterium]